MKPASESGHPLLMLPCYLCQFLVSCGPADPAKPLSMALLCVAAIDIVCSNQVAF